MRVIAGTAKGTQLHAPPGRRVRPTRDQVREALFSILGPRIERARFLDLYAGTGANGIEALSRGATGCTFVDNHGPLLKVIQRNLEATRLAERAQVRKLTLPNGLRKLREHRARYDVIFADPPYACTEYDALFAQIRQTQLLEPKGLIVLEHAARTTVADEIGGYHRTRHNRYGDTCLSFFLDAQYGMC